MANQAYLDYVARLRAKHGDRFSEAGLAAKFANHFGQRVEVEFSHGGVRRGWVSGTAGWQPSLMILPLRTSTGSSWLVSDRDKIVKVVDGGPR